MRQLVTVIYIITLTFFSRAQDTFSICAIDTLTGEVGSAGASCVYYPPQGIMTLSDVHPGIGVIHTQAAYESENQAYARDLMNQGLSPQQIIDSLVANDANNNPTIRQYGIVDFRDGVVRSAAYTGIDCLNHKDHIIGPNYAIQGNILLGQEILDSMEARFLNSQEELACRLMEALQGANVPGADKRCLSEGISSIGVFLRVAKPDDPDNDLYLQFNLLKVDEGVDPLDSLQVLIDQWGGCNPSGVSDITEKEIVKVFPNPANDIVKFNIADKISYKNTILVIYNPKGQKEVELLYINNKALIWHTKMHSPGLYLYQLIENNVLVDRGKFIIE